jgi:hypothetical protein
MLGSDSNTTKMAIFDKYLSPANYQNGAPIGVPLSDLPVLIRRNIFNINLPDSNTPKHKLVSKKVFLRVITTRTNENENWPLTINHLNQS